MKDRAAKIATYFWESHGNLIETEWRANLCRAIRLAVKDERERCLLAGQGGEVPNDIGELRRRLEQAEADRDVLAAEVESWRRAFDEQTGKQIGDSSDCRDVLAARSATDKSGALTRAKEAE